MKKKVFFVVSSLGAGGSERVFWLLTQGFDKTQFEVFIVYLGGEKDMFSTNLENVRVINLMTFRASRSFGKLFALIKKERPYAIFSTGAHINVLVAIISLFVKIPFLIARESNVYREMAKVNNVKQRFWVPMIEIFYRRFNKIVCQSAEISSSFLNTFRLPQSSLIIIPNPVKALLPGISSIKSELNGKKKILIVARLATEKMHSRLLNIFAGLPNDFHLSIAGDGPCRAAITKQINALGIADRVCMLGEMEDVDKLYQNHQLCLLTSVTEGFPNALLESIANGTPVVAFRVGGLSNLVIEGFNGYTIDQHDDGAYAFHVQKACSQVWDHQAMMDDAQNRFSLNKIASCYQSLIS